MRKFEEMTSGCMARAGYSEMTFVLLSRDAAAPVAIRAWIAERLRTGKNRETDPQIVEAEACAATMEAEGATLKHTARENTLVHFAVRPFVAKCGADVPNQWTTRNPDNVSCPECRKEINP